jgi:Protein of unknown function (DUF3014)
MSNSIPIWSKVVAAIIALGGVTGGVYYFNRPASKPATPQSATPIAQPITATPAVKYPVPIANPEAQEEPASPLPDLNDSDVSAIADLLTLFDHPAVAALLKPEFLIPRIVATVDNLPREKLNSHALPVKTVPGTFIVDTHDNEVLMATANSARYDAYVDAFANADTGQMLVLYQRWYPLFQQAYRDLGDPNAYFNDRLIEVIDHLLRAPDAPTAIALVKPRSTWEYADPDLQAASIGHRLLFRIGPAHAARVKSKLIELRSGLAALAAKPQ